MKKKLVSILLAGCMILQNLGGVVQAEELLVEESAIVAEENENEFSELQLEIEENVVEIENEEGDDYAEAYVSEDVVMSIEPEETINDVLEE